MLKRGNTGEAVIMLQVALREVGLYKYRIDGDFGGLTEKAVKDFQQAAGLSSDGIVGNGTWTALNNKTSILSNQVLYCMVHATASPGHIEFNAYQIMMMHMGPCDLPDGRVRYKAKTYASRAHLPREFIGGISVAKLTGRGWTKPGYRKMIHQDGGESILTPSNNDTVIEGFEVTFGALGFNNNCIHIVYVGGTEADGRTPKDTRTDAQVLTLAKNLKGYLETYPHIKFLGHNQVANKACPCFSVEDFCKEIGIPEANIF
jgi:N-acetylmuramoyl-L-alanine amidase